MADERDDYREREPPARGNRWAALLARIERHAPLELVAPIALAFVFIFLMCGGVPLLLFKPAR